MPLCRLEPCPLFRPRREALHSTGEATVRWEQCVYNAAALSLDGTIYVVYRALGYDGVSRLGIWTSRDGVTELLRPAFPVFGPTEPYEMPADPEGRRREHRARFNMVREIGGTEDPRLVPRAGQAAGPRSRQARLRACPDRRLRGHVPGRRRAPRRLRRQPPGGRSRRCASKSGSPDEDPLSCAGADTDAPLVSRRGRRGCPPVGRRLGMHLLNRPSLGSDLPGFASTDSCPWTPGLVPAVYSRVRSSLRVRGCT